MVTMPVTLVDQVLPLVPMGLHVQSASSLLAEFRYSDVLHQ